MEFHSTREFAAMGRVGSIWAFRAARTLCGVALFLSIETLQLAIQPYLYDEGGVIRGFPFAPHVGFFC